MDYDPDKISQANVPNLNELIHASTYSLNIRALIRSVILPYMTSIFLNVPPEEHGRSGIIGIPVIGQDTAGHRHGWMSAKYLQLLANADRGIGGFCRFCQRLQQ
jgi:hypothetical protein